MRQVLLAAILVLAAACAPSPEPAMDATPGGGAPAAGPLPLRRFDEAVRGRFRHHSGLEDPAREAVRDAAAWGALWARITAGSSPAPTPAVDFGREMLLVAAMGQRPTGGHEIAIESVADTGDALEARVVETSPGPRCGTAAALTQPVDVVAIPRSDRPVRWRVRAVVADCP